MNCRRARHQIHLALDGEQKAEERRQLESHLARCSACNRLSAQLSGIQDAMGRLGELPGCDHLPPAARLAVAHLRLGRIAAAAMLAVAVGGLWMNSRLEVSSTLSAPRPEDQRLAAPDPIPVKPAAVPGGMSAAGRDKVRIKVDSPAAIVVPAQSSNPNVTVVWIYPTRPTADSGDHRGRPAPSFRRSQL